MCTGTVPASADEALGMLESGYGFLAGTDPAQLPEEVVARVLRRLEHADARQAAVRGRFLAAFDARNAHLADGQRTTRAWLVHATRVTLEVLPAPERAFCVPSRTPGGTGDSTRTTSRGAVGPMMA